MIGNNPVFTENIFLGPLGCISRRNKYVQNSKKTPERKRKFLVRRVYQTFIKNDKQKNLIIPAIILKS